MVKVASENARRLLFSGYRPTTKAVKSAPPMRKAIREDSGARAGRRCLSGCRAVEQLALVVRAAASDF